MAAAFGDVYREHITPVWRFVVARVPGRADAEDVTSDVFVRALRGWQRYDPDRGTVGAWLGGIARRAVADWWRDHGREVPVGVAGEPAGTTSTSGAIADLATRVVERVAAGDVRRHLHLLTDHERDAVALRFGAGLSSAEVGEALGVSDVAARMLVYRAVGKLRAVMPDD